MSVHRRLTLAALLVACAASLAAASGMFATVTWTNAGTGDWDTVTNWDTVAEPTAADDAVISNGGTALVTTAGNQANQVLVAATGTGHLQVTGAGRLEAVLRVRIGTDGGVGTALVDDGGQLTHAGLANLHLGLATGNATLTVDGAGSRVIDSSGTDIEMAFTDAVATLNLRNGGELTGTTVAIGRNGGEGTINIGDGGAAGILNAGVFGEFSANRADVNFNHSDGITYSHVMSGGVTVTKSGGGTLVLTGVNTYTGSTTLQDGLLTINGSQPASDVTVTGGQLGGIGTIGDLTATGGAVGPGESAGILSSGSVSFNSATVFVIEIDGTVAGSGYDVLEVTGTVALGGANLVIAPSIAPAGGTVFRVIDNDGADVVTGTFAGLAEGAAITEGGATYRVSYAGGDGNDVTLTATGDAVVVAPAALPAMTVSEPYTVTFTATGGLGPYTFSVSAGAVPAGLALNGTTGVLAGTPTTAGDYAFSITATDSLGSTGVRAYTGEVLPAPVPSLPMVGFLGLAALLGAVGYFRLHSGVA